MTIHRWHLQSTRQARTLCERLTDLLPPLLRSLVFLQALDTKLFVLYAPEAPVRSLHCLLQTAAFDLQADMPFPVLVECTLEDPQTHATTLVLQARQTPPSARSQVCVYELCMGTALEATMAARMCGADSAAEVEQLFHMHLHDRNVYVIFRGPSDRLALVMSSFTAVINGRINLPSVWKRIHRPDKVPGLRAEVDWVTELARQADAQGLVPCTPGMDLSDWDRFDKNVAALSGIDEEHCQAFCRRVREVTRIDLTPQEVRKLNWVMERYLQTVMMAGRDILLCKEGNPLMTLERLLGRHCD